MFRHLLLLLICLVTPLQGIAAEQQCETIRVSGHANLPPLSWYQNNEMHGAGITTLQQLFQQQNIELITVDSASPQRLLKELAKGHIDITVTATSTPESLTVVNLVKPAIYSASLLILVRKDSNLQPTEWKDLQHLRGVVAHNLDLGDEFEQYAEKHLTLDRVQRSSQSLLMLDAKRVDYVIYPLIEADLLISLYNYEGKLRKTPIEITTQEFYIGISKNTSCNLSINDISSALKEMQKNGRMERNFNDSLFHWMGTHL